RRAVAGHVGGLGSDLLHHLRAHVLELVLELDLLRHRDAVFRDRRGAERALEHDVAALRAERHLHRVSQDVQAVNHPRARAFVKPYLFCWHCLSLLLILGMRADGMPMGCLGALDDAHDVFLAHHEELLALHLDGLAGVLAEEHLVAGLDVQGDELALIVFLALADGHDLALVGLLGRRVGNDDAPCGPALLFDALDDHAVMQRTDFHADLPFKTLCPTMGCAAFSRNSGARRLPLTRTGVSTQAQRVLIVKGAVRIFKAFPALAVTLALALTHLSAATAATSRLPRPVTQALAAAHIPPAAMSAVVVDLDTGKSVFATQDRTPRNAASLMKLVTTFAALELLTPDYRWTTEVYADGALADGVLAGDLIFRGAGDPRLDYESFWMLLRALRARGLREIRGRVIVDRSRFAPDTDEPIDEESFRPYNVPPDALLVNYKAVRFVFLPDLARNAVRIFVQPPLPGMAIVNELSIVERSCPEGRAFRELIGAAFERRPPRASFTGVFPASCGERDLNVALHAPDDYFAAMFEHLWTELGGTWSGE